MLASALLPLLAFALPSTSPFSAPFAAPNGRLVVRQDATSDYLRGLDLLTTLATEAAGAIASGGDCADECGAFITAISPCTASGDSEADYTAAAACSCQPATISATNSCGNCLGGDSAKGAKTVADQCNSYASSLGVGSALETATSSGNSATSASTSGTSSPTSSPTAAEGQENNDNAASTLLRGAGFTVAAVAAFALAA
ncbi:hypothetical protein JCM6882_002404 [Rhodosporidiobolus microsporus]